MRFWSIGRPEAHFWHHNVISVPDTSFAPESDGQPVGVLTVNMHHLCTQHIFELTTQSEADG